VPKIPSDQRITSGLPIITGQNHWRALTETYIGRASFRQNQCNVQAAGAMIL